MFVVLWTALGSGNAIRSGTAWYLPVTLFITIYGTLLVVITRYGLFAVVVAVFAINSAINLVLTANFVAWYGLSSWITLAALVGLALIGFKLSLGDRPLIPVFEAERAVPAR